MKTLTSTLSRPPAASLLLAAGLALAQPGQARVIDDFNDNTKTGWTDSNPASQPLPGGQEANGQFTFTMPAIGQPYFVASTKSTETFELKEGRTIEFRVDMISGLGGDSFAVMGFIPLSTGANTLAGYGIAKSETDLLITKGINKYFYDENVQPPLKNENVTLVLNLKAKGGKVYIDGRVLDKDDGNRVIWEGSFVDTAEADVLAEGQDTPPAPFITSGNFVLYLYADGGQDPNGYQVVFDNAEVFICDTAVVDDFNDNTRTGWEDSDPGNFGLPGGQEAGGRFTFTMNPLGQSYFVASAKKTLSFELTEGTKHEFHVDMVSGQGPDSFAVLSWIPTATGAKTLAGYGIAKSESDVLITKGINKYFYNDDPTPAIKNDNVRLSLELTVVHGNVEIRGRIYDKDDNDAVLFDQTFIDTPAADVLAEGQDSPPAPFIATGNIVLYLYADGGQDPSGYQVVYDNLDVCAPPAAGNQPPVITDVLPKTGANFLAAPAQVTFKAADDKSIPDAGISVTLNGTVYTTANGVTLGGTPVNRTVTLGGLALNQTFVGEVEVVDADGASRKEAIWFDTFATNNRLIEIEDYNFEAGQFFDDPVRTGEGGGQAENSYTDRIGVPATDFHETRGTPNRDDTMYRTQDPIRMQHTLDQRRAGFDSDLGVWDYDVGDIAAGEWMNYTKNITGCYEVYLREAVVNFPQAESVLEQVTSDPSQPDQTVRVVGSFLGSTSGYTFRNFPLTDGTGENKVILRLSGKTTFRLRQVTADNDVSARFLNYLIFLPVSCPEKQRAAITTVSPANAATLESVTPAVSAVIQNRDTTVNTGSVVLQVNGATVAATVTPTADGATVAYNLSPLPPANSTVACRLAFRDSDNIEIASDWSFTLTYKQLDPANRQPGPGKDRGLSVRMVQQPLGEPTLENSLTRAEGQLAPNSSIPVYVDTTTVEPFVNMDQAEQSAGYFTQPDYPEYLVPGLDGSNGTDDFSVEIKGWLELAASVYRFGVVTDDGYKISSGASLASKDPVLGFYSGGPANATFDFFVPIAGLYPFRMIWYERGGGAHAEWFSVDIATGERTLINDPQATKAIKAYLDVVPAPAVKVQSSATVASGYADDASAVIDTNAKRITIPMSGAMRFYRLVGGSALKITSTQLQATNIVMTYE